MKSRSQGPRKTLASGPPRKRAPASGGPGGQGGETEYTGPYRLGSSAAACTYATGDAEDELAEEIAMVPLSIDDAAVRDKLPFDVTRETVTVQGSMPPGARAQFVAIAQRLRLRQLIPPDKARRGLKEGGDYAVIWRETKTKLWTQCETEQGYPGLAKALSDGQLIGCEARGDTRTGTFAVFASKYIGMNRVVGVETGVLWTKAAYEAAEASEHELDRLLGIHATDIKAADLSGLGYKGPDLVLEVTSCANECKFLNDPSWAHSDGSRVANVQACLVFDSVAELPRIAYFATRPIKAGEELFVDWGKRTWAGICTAQLIGQARMSKALWQKQKLLQSAFGDALPMPHAAGPGKCVLYFDGTADSYCSLVATDGWLAAIQRGENLADSDDSEAATKPARKKPTRFEAGSASVARVQRFKAVGTADAFRQVGCTYNNTLDMTALDEAAAIQEQLKSLCPPADSFDKSCQDMMRPGVQTHVEVVQVVDETHPCRVFTLPDATAFGLRATKAFTEDEPILPYHGKIVRADAASEDNFYLYDMTAGLKGYDGPALVVDPRHSGNEARFVNDAWKPEAGQPILDPHDHSPFFAV